MVTLLSGIAVAFIDNVHLCLYHCRLASLSEKRVKQDQSKVEDTLSLNRQSNVEEDFAKFIDEARVDVIDRFQTLFPPKEKIYTEIYYRRVACLIFEVRPVIFSHFSKSCLLINFKKQMKIEN